MAELRKRDKKYFKPFIERDYEAFNIKRVKLRYKTGLRF